MKAMSRKMIESNQITAIYHCRPRCDDERRHYINNAPLLDAGERHRRLALLSAQKK